MLVWAYWDMGDMKVKQSIINRLLFHTQVMDIVAICQVMRDDVFLKM